MKKLLCLIFAGLMLTCMPVSAAEGPEASAEVKQEMMNTFWNTYALDPFWQEMVPDLLDAWYAETGTELHWDYQRNYGNNLLGIRNYGYHAGCVVFLLLTPLPDECTIQVAESTFWLPIGFTIEVYKDGAFCTLQEAYDSGILSVDDIQNIAILHDCYDLEVEYYGEYDGCHIGFINGGPSDYAQAECTITIAGMDFWFPDYQPLMVYRDGQMVELQSAYDMGWLSDREVERLWNYYTNGIYEDNPHTGDGILMPVVLLMTSSTGLCVFSFRKKRV